MLHNFTASTAQEGDAEEAYKAAESQCSGKAQQNKGYRSQQADILTGAACTQADKALQHQPFTGKAVRQRNSGKRQRADESKDSGIRHFACETAEQLQVFAAGAVHNAAGTHKHQHLHNAVVKGMHQRCHKAQHIKAAAGSLHQHTAAEGSKNYAHIFH